MKIKYFTSFLIVFLINIYQGHCFVLSGSDIADPFVVVLDAGHGGHDPGNLGNGYLEKNIALQIVLKIGAILEQDPNFKVIYTRKDDTFIDLYERGEIANKANANLFVSVHCDSHSSDAHGAGTFVLGLHVSKQNFEIAKKENSVIYLEDNYETKYAGYDINSPESVIGLTIMQEEFLDQSIALAKMIQDNFTNKLKRNNRKVKQAGFIVLHQTFMPSVLVETGFLTNKTEGAFLNSKAGQVKMGTAIAEAILKYKIAVSGTSLNDDYQIEKPIEIPEVPEKKEVTVPKEHKETKVFEEEEVTAAEEVIPAEEVIAEVKDMVKKEIPVAEKEIDKAEEAIRPVSIEKNVPKEIKVTTKKEEKPKVTIVFKVQLMATTKKIALEADNFNGLNRLSKEPVNNLFRYMYGNTTSYQQVKLMKNNADLKGYTSSFIVAYKDGVRISLADALKYVGE